MPPIDERPPRDPALDDGLLKVLLQSEDCFCGDAATWDHVARARVGQLPGALMVTDTVKPHDLAARLEEYYGLAVLLVDFLGVHFGLVEEYSVDLLDKVVDLAATDAADPEPGSAAVGPEELRRSLTATVLRHLPTTGRTVSPERAEHLVATVLGVALSGATVGDTRNLFGDEAPPLRAIDHLLAAGVVPDDVERLDDAGNVVRGRQVRDPDHPWAVRLAGHKQLFLRLDLILFVYLFMVLGNWLAPSSVRKLKTKVRLAVLSWALDNGVLAVAGWVAPMFDHGRAHKLPADLVARTAAARAARGLTARSASVVLKGDATVQPFKADLALRLVECGLPPCFRSAAIELGDVVEADDAPDRTADDGRGGPAR